MYLERTWSGPVADGPGVDNFVGSRVTFKLKDCAEEQQSVVPTCAIFFTKFATLTKARIADWWVLLEEQLSRKELIQQRKSFC